MTNFIYQKILKIVNFVRSRINGLITPFQSRKPDNLTNIERFFADLEDDVRNPNSKGLSPEQYQAYKEGLEYDTVTVFIEMCRKDVRLSKLPLSDAIQIALKDPNYHFEFIEEEKSIKKV